MNCLIIEDDLMMRRSLEILCSRIPGIVLIDSVDNGRDALEVLDNCKPDVILLDMNLPYISGWEIMDKVPSHIHIICTSASEFPETYSYKDNILAKFLKPVKPNELHDALKKVSMSQCY